MPRAASSFARKSVVSRRPRLETSWPLASARVPGGSRTAGSASAAGIDKHIAKTIAKTIEEGVDGPEPRTVTR